MLLFFSFLIALSLSINKTITKTFKPILLNNVSSSYVSQIISITSEYLLEKIKLKLPKESGLRMFYSHQLEGCPMLYDNIGSAAKPDEYQITFFYPPFHAFPSNCSRDYKFKIVSNFNHSDIIEAELTYSEYKGKTTIQNTLCLTLSSKLFNVFDLLLLSLIGILSLYLIYSSPKRKLDSLGIFFIYFSSLFLNSFIDPFLIISISFFLLIKRRNHSEICFIFCFLMMTKNWIPFCFFILSHYYPYNYFYISFIILCISFYFNVPSHPFLFSFIAFLLLTYKYRTNLSKHAQFIALIIVLHLFVFLFIHLFNLQSILQPIITEKPTEIFKIDYWKPEYTQTYLGDSIEKMISTLKQPINLTNCKHCSFKPTGNVSSTEKDLVLIQVPKSPKYAVLSLKTLRTTGCRARIFCIYKANEYIDKETLDFFGDCGINIFPYYEYEGGDEYAFRGLKHMTLARLLCKTNNLVNRVLYFDVFTTYFQADPFIGIISNNSIYVSSEHRNVLRSDWLRSYLDQLPGYLFFDAIFKEAYSASIYGGYSNVIQTFEELFITFFHKWNFITEELGIFNFILYKSYLSHFKFTYTVDESLSTVNWQDNSIYTGNKPGEFMYIKSHKYPSSINQIFPSDLMQNETFNIC